MNCDTPPNKSRDQLHDQLTTVDSDNMTSKQH